MGIGEPVALAEAAHDLVVEQRGAAVVVTIDRPRALNALSTAMRADLDAAISRIAPDPQTYAVVMRSGNARAFCSGGDVRELRAWGTSEQEAERRKARQSLKDEYALNWKLECFSKPVVSLIDGMVMGSGVGVTLYGTHRVGGPNYRFAMPETAIGLFPDVGACHAFSRLPDSVGMYLGLTGHGIGRADAFRLGLLTHCIEADAFDAIIAGLSEAEPVDPILDTRHKDPEPGELEPRFETIARCFSAPSVEEICRRLASVTGAHEVWAKSVLADLGRRSPTSLKITHRHIRDSHGQTLRETLQSDYRIACRCLDGHDFFEGVRAALIDKDGRPKWRPSRLDEVTPELIDRHFADLGADDLSLPTREEMQDPARERRRLPANI